MRRFLTRPLIVMACFAVAAHAQCASDNRSDKHGGVLVTDFTITGTATLDSTELTHLAADFIRSCYDDDPEEMQERLRAAFQNRGYFTVEVKSLSFKAGDPLGVPKPVAVEADVAEGPIYKVGEIAFSENHALTSERLRNEFPLKKGDVFGRDKVASGLESLLRLYASTGFLDSFAIPETDPSSNGTIDLKVKVNEGPQYHMGKLEILAAKETTARLRAEWKMPEGSTYDASYIGTFVDKNHSLLPEGFTTGNILQVFNCPDAVVDVSLILDPREGKPDAPVKNIPCGSQPDKSK